MPVPPAIRIHRHVDIDGSGCWRWNGTTTPEGYPLMHAGGRAESVRRVAYREFRGPIPAGARVRTTCGERGCVNPEHLEAYLQADAFRPQSASARRAQDRDRKRRARATETPEQIAERQRADRRRYRRKVARARVAAVPSGSRLTVKGVS